MSQLELKEYSSLIQLESEYTPLMLNYKNKEEIINELLGKLLYENNSGKELKIPSDYNEKRNMLRGLLNIRKPKPLDGEFIQKLDTILQSELLEKGVVDVNQLSTISSIMPNTTYNQKNKFILWQGDITKLKADVIVNAANKYLLGCFQPLHACIDNAIHSAAGPQLREDCETIMSIQDELEQTGNAKITRAYNLPAKFVLHTVGPIVPKGTNLMKTQKEELASSYKSCLELANMIEEIRTIAFCAISTGVFGFPKKDAAFIAVETVNEWLNRNNNHFEKIIFNVFSEEDYKVYLHVFQP